MCWLMAITNVLTKQKGKGESESSCSKDMTAPSLSGGQGTTLLQPTKEDPDLLASHPTDFSGRLALPDEVFLW